MTHGSPSMGQSDIFMPAAVPFASAALAAAAPLRLCVPGSGRIFVARSLRSPISQRSFSLLLALLSAAAFSLLPH